MYMLNYNNSQINLYDNHYVYGFLNFQISNYYFFLLYI